MSEETLLEDGYGLARVEQQRCGAVILAGGEGMRLRPLVRQVLGAGEIVSSRPRPPLTPATGPSGRSRRASDLPPRMAARSRAPAQPAGDVR